MSLPVTLLLRSSLHGEALEDELCRCKSLNYLVKSVGAQSLDTYRIFFYFLFMWGSIQIEQHDCVYFVQKKEKSKENKERKK